MSVEENTDLILNFNKRVFKDKNLLKKYKIIANLRIGKTQFHMENDNGPYLIEYMISSDNSIICHINLSTKNDDISISANLSDECLEIFQLFNKIKPLFKEIFIDDYKGNESSIYKQFISKGWYLRILMQDDKLSFSFTFFNKYKDDTVIKYDSGSPLQVFLDNNKLHGDFLDFCAQNIYKKYSVEITDFSDIDNIKTIIEMVKA